MDDFIFDVAAPVYTRASETIRVPRDLVWAIVSDFDGWPDWNPDVHEARLDGPLGAGSRITWTMARGQTLRTRIAVCTPPCRIGIVATTGDLRITHLLTLKDRDGWTLVTAESSLASGLARLLPGLTERALCAALRRGLRALRRESDRCRA